MGSVTVKIDGLAELGQAMKELGDEVVLKTSRTATRAAANLVRDAAKALAPVKTGALRDAIQVRRDKQLSSPGFEVMAVGVFKIRGATFANSRSNRQKGRAGKKYDTDPPAYYWKFVEFGTVKMSPKPMLRPAFDQNKSAAVVAMEDALSKGIDKATKKAGK